MSVQQDFLGVKDLKELSPRRRGELHEALEDLLSNKIQTRLEALDRLCLMDAHRRSPLAASILVFHINELDLRLRARIVEAISQAIKPIAMKERSPVKVREFLHLALRKMGEREVYSLLQLIAEKRVSLEIVCLLLNQCSFSGEILVNILKHRHYEVPIRIAASEVIGQIGFLEARQAVEALEKRLAHRATGQLSMSFASRSREEAKELIPALRKTIDALREASI
jgi:hypothetical protein